MLDKLWNRWKDVATNDPVKARLIKVLAMAGVIVIPFLTVWAWLGFAKAAGMVFLLGVSGLMLLLGAVGVNFLFGWTAHYVFYGSLKDYGEWLSTSIMDEWESYQNKKARQQAHATARASAGAAASFVVKDVEMAPPPKVQATNLNSTDEAGPEWLRK